jgi:hypothetical protein
MVVGKELGCHRGTETRSERWIQIPEEKRGRVADESARFSFGIHGRG